MVWYDKNAMESIYSGYENKLRQIAISVTEKIRDYGNAFTEETGEKLYEHLSWRIKSEESMRKKCVSDGIPETAHSALKEIHDAIGIRIVCLFIDDIRRNVEKIRQLQGSRVVQEKDYIHVAKPNGYRSYHLILQVEDSGPDIDGNTPGTYFVEVQLRTIAMDTWAALEHEMKYKKDIRHPELISAELKRCADELAACDVSMQTIRDLIRG